MTRGTLGELSGERLSLFIYEEKCVKIFGDWREAERGCSFQPQYVLCSGHAGGLCPSLPLAKSGV